MKNIVKITVAICIFNINAAFAQEYSYEVKTAKKIEISELQGQIKIVGQSGSNILIMAQDMEDYPERAKGLHPISGGGVDNTNVGLNISEINGVISIKGATKQSGDATYTFKIPNNIALNIDYSSPFTADKVLVEDFGGEFEMSALNDGVKLNNVTGPVFLDLVNGDIEIAFSSVNQKSPMSIKTINGEIDLTLPASAKVNLELNTLHGDVFTDLDINIEKPEKKEDNGWFLAGSSKTNGTLNGGGVKLNISTINGNIYLRKK